MENKKKILKNTTIVMVVLCAIFLITYYVIIPKTINYLVFDSSNSILTKDATVVLSNLKKNKKLLNYYLKLNKVSNEDLINIIDESDNSAIKNIIIDLKTDKVNSLSKFKKSLYNILNIENNNNHIKKMLDKSIKANNFTMIRNKAKSLKLSSFQLGLSIPVIKNSLIEYLKSE